MEDAKSNNSSEKKYDVENGSIIGDSNRVEFCNNSSRRIVPEPVVAASMETNMNINQTYQLPLTKAKVIFTVSSSIFQQITPKNLVNEVSKNHV